jgi:superfamily II DNA or RNA helicase
MIEPGQIIKNLIPSESVTISKVQKLGNMYSITYSGINSNKVNTKVIDENTFQNLEVLTSEGSFNFTGNPVRFSLFAEAERINSAYQFDPLFAVNCSIVDPLPHQVEAVYKYLLPLPKIRFLLADDTGAGKTIMTGLLVKELLMRGIIERILIITPGGLTKQWQEDELGLKFNIPFKLVNRATFLSDPNIFSNSDRLITSIDFLRSDDILNIVKETSWDLIIVDEAHKLSAFDYGQKKYVSKRYQALETLAAKCEHLLLLTATPHRGRRDTFKNLLQLLDEDIFASDSLVTSRIKEIGESGVNKFFIRRLKEEMRDWEGNPLFKERHTKTTLYNLTPEEKKLYDKVTEYLTKKREEAKEEANIHVSLALMVMQRRLTSSIYAIMRTLKNRYNALKGLLDELAQNPNLWKQKQKLDLDFQSLDDFDEFDDEEREGLENILSDPKKFKLFTTAKSPKEINEEAEQVKALVELAENLYNSNQEEQKFKKLRELLQTEGVLAKNEKLVIFTEHKDTLDYLEQRLRNNGYRIATIHGGKTVEERRASQSEFAREAQILIATDAAGEGINLQFCRLLINWDIPWNPNRLEQRMGRIHRYGQKQDVLVFNLVAQNTREGNVLHRLLNKLDLIREQMGDDRVYDVISDVFEGVNLDEIINSTFNGTSTSYDLAIDSELTEENVKNKLIEKKEKLGYSTINYQDAQRLKEDSDEKRLQPIYIRLFFEKAFKNLNGKYTEIRKSIFQIDEIPEPIVQVLKDDYNISADIKQIKFCFDKQVFLDYQNLNDLGRVHYINPGNPLFDSLIKVVRNEYKEDMLKGTILVSPDDNVDFFAFFVKSQISDNRPHKEGESIADEKLMCVYNFNNSFKATSPAKFIDLHAPGVFAKEITPPDVISNEEVTNWCFENITVHQFEDTKVHVQNDANTRKQYLEEAFNNIIMDILAEINELQGKILLGDQKVEDKIQRKQERIEELKRKKIERLQKLELMQQLSMKPPHVLGCAYVVPLSQVEYNSHYGMHRDDEVEEIAMNVAMDFERNSGWNPFDVSADNTGYDIKSVSPEGLKKYIEVKGRSVDGGVMLSENEMNRLAQLEDNAWLYIVINCKSSPSLYRIQNPANNLKFELKPKGVQYYLPMEEWKNKMN